MSCVNNVSILQAFRFCFVQSNTPRVEKRSVCNVHTHVRMFLYSFENELLIIIIIMVIFKCYFSGELIALS